MSQHLEFFEQLFSQLRTSDDYKEYKLQRDLVKGRYNYKELHGGLFLVSFVRIPQGGVRSDWTISELGFFRLEMLLDNKDSQATKLLFDKIEKHREVIENHIGVALDWERKDGLGSPSRGRSIIALYYKSENDNNKRIEWTMKYAKPFIDTLTKYI